MRASMVHSNLVDEENVSLSIIILAYNEEHNLPATIKSIHDSLQERISSYEIILVNDGSTDKTLTLCKSYADKDPTIRVLNNPKNMGCGYTFNHGVQAAKGTYLWLIPGDGEIGTNAMITIVDKLGTSDMVIPYVINFSTRPLIRRIISWGYTTLLNILFLKHLHYYNGPCIFRTSLAQSVPIANSRGFAFMAPILLRLIKRGSTYTEVGIKLEPRLYGNPSINQLFNIFSTVKPLAGLFWELNVASLFPVRNPGENS